VNLPLPPDRWDIARLRQERAEAVSAFGFTERQARFLVEVLIHSGVFVERQYCTFAGITHGQKTHDFLTRLVERGYARPILVGSLHRGRLFHVHYKPLYAAVGQADNRHRKTMPLGKMVERLMVLDAVLADRTFTWLGTESDKRSYFMRRLQGRVELREFPRLTFGAGGTVRHRYFPDKMPIGIQSNRTDHVFMYLITNPIPMDFRLFLIRHSELLRPLHGWTIRVLVPEPFAKAIRVFGHAARESLATPIAPSTAEGIQSYFHERKRRQGAPPEPPSDGFRSATMAYRAPRFQALYRVWQQEGDPIIWAAQSATLKDALERREGRVEFVTLARQYLHLSSLVGVA
jgi:hypothetical protein